MEPNNEEIDMSSNVLLLSLRPKYAKQVFSGTKKIELRRVKPKLNEGDTVLVYVSSPVKQVWGTFTVARIIDKPIRELWALVENEAGISKDEFYRYYSGVDHGYGIYIKDIKSIFQPIDLHLIKEQWSNFHPPQSYQYLSHDQLNEFLSC
ncbi:MAG: ASCH domain-containing protein [Anaerolineaceae bacterium]